MPAQTVLKLQVPIRAVTLTIRLGYLGILRPAFQGYPDADGFSSRPLPSLWYDPPPSPAWTTGKKPLNSTSCSYFTPATV